jgi:NAD(P)-dependent dehydrogenase (short-subunit alcohol dehydrogenase family)
MNRSVLITGASSGFGRLAAQTLAHRGHQVFAGLRDRDGRNQQAATELEKLDLHVVELDVTDQASADRAVAEMHTRAGRIDVVINNAGLIFPGPVEAFGAEDLLHQLDVSVLGALRVNRAALPHLRAQGHGVLIQMGSMAGSVSLPFSGLYSASKAALKSLTDTWHHELAPYGVESVIIQPASYPTSIGVNARPPSDLGRLEPYGEAMNEYVTNLIARSAELGGDPQEVADALVALVEMPDGERPRWLAVGPQPQREAVDAVNQAEQEATAKVALDMGIAASMSDRR